MKAVRSNASGIVLLAAGVIIGWSLASLPGPRAIVRANSGDRVGGSTITTGPVLVRYDEGRKVQVTQDALYYLDYSSARLFATVPSFRQSAGPARIIDNFAERDLAADFKIDLANGQVPKFMMTTGELGAYSEGWAPLFVFETTTNQVAAYKVQQQMVGLASKHRFDLIQVMPVGSKQGTQALR
ncbi:hypothetical protein [Singulisphaera sp. PoT]|uniref:hypothetical protein n=1 Tax=Singulisphaera sp. PoT TaxID=3411797 RepID=UPI003BF4D688